MIDFNEYKANIAGKKCVVIGLGISNLPLIAFLNDLGVASIEIRDNGGKNDKQRAEIVAKCESLKASGQITNYKIGEDYLKDIEGDIAFKTPGLRYDNPELVKAKNNGVYVTSEMEEFVKLVPCKTIAVTGSDGKTTTTTLIYKMLEKEFESTDRRVWVGGNIGKPLFSHIAEIKPVDFVVLELSSFQLMSTSMDIDVSVITNITPNHLDWHKSYEEYIEAKQNIYKHAGTDSIFVKNAKNDVTSRFVGNGENRSFCIDNEVKNGAFCEAGKIYFAKEGDAEFVMDVSEIKIPGKYNIENYLAAISAVFDFVSTETIKEVARNFGGVEHRMEWIRDLDGVKYYNGSIDSSPNRTINALSVFEKRNIVLMAGGKDKGVPFDALGPAICAKVKVLVLTGPTSEPISKAVEDFCNENKEAVAPKIIKVDDFEEAAKLCRANAEVGDIVLLSPASTSFDRFKNFEERGKKFKDIVNSFV